MNELLPKIAPNDLTLIKRNPVDAETLSQAAEILAEVERRGDAALAEFAVRYGDRAPGEPLILGRDELQQAFDDLNTDDQQLLVRCAERIKGFAEHQRSAIVAIATSIPGGMAGHTVSPVERAGCYAPGGRHPLPSTVLMTVVTARIAGVEEVWAASPKPARITLAAAAVAGADKFLAVGGAQAIGALAYGTETVPACDIIVGPGNRWVTAAKQLVSGQVNIDIIAGPSELVILADESANVHLVALDLLAQAEHDTDALPILLATDDRLIDSVRSRLKILLDETPDETAQAALSRGCAVSVQNLEQGIRICNALAPEHLQLNLTNPDSIIPKLRHYGALFIGEKSAEVFGDYGAGPNHVLPTSGAARRTAGLSVMNFLRFPTWMRIDDPESARELAEDSAALATLEGLNWHAEAARARLWQQINSIANRQ